MNNKELHGESALERIATGVPGLDEVLKGGFYEGAVYIVRGTPGAGKTILANQICFHQARQGKRALFVTLLAENHARMLQHLEQMSFYDSHLIPKYVYYISAFRVLEENGLKGMMDLLRREMKAHEATILILDGLIAVEETSTSDREFRKFIHELQAHAAAAGCCTLLLTNGRRGEYHPEHTMVDGLVTLEDVPYGKRRQRELEVRKFRGSASLRGRHPFQITDDGLVVHPRPESRFLRNTASGNSGTISTGVDQIDNMTGGGLLADSSTLLLGPSGAGKTTLGTAFLQKSSKAEPGLHFGFYESPERLIGNAKLIGIDLQSRVDAGHLEILWRPPVERILDSLGNELIDAVRRRKVRRLFIDGWGGFAAAAETADRLSPFFAAIANELRSLGVTTICAMETANLIGPDLHLPAEGVSAVAENMILLRYAEYQNQLRRMISIMKVRGSGFDHTLREFEIGALGLHLLDSFKNAEGVLTGLGTERASNSSRPAKHAKKSSSVKKTATGRRTNVRRRGKA
ncbi:ATPase domain-containing protein [Steroidobacter sp.]|uniref:ATPase domain-containing protein n=1 Tax=Steroidobacter sp. TaxID=1978227 RepID=UPI001A3EA636|nr:ATPase domain-containing protein [Steroidobacter sp.]MBL8269908.1 AAA family ATPase [Steroidobacter sp.]